MLTTAEIAKLTDQYDSLSWLECDGLSQVLHKVLSDAGVAHSFCVGRVVYRTESGVERLVKVHCWLEIVESALIVDYRLRMWLDSQPDVPHGVFNPADYSAIWYVGEAKEVALPSEAVFRALVDTSEQDYTAILAKLNRRK